jgi:ribosomal protein L11 methyltransferase
MQYIGVTLGICELPEDKREILTAVLDYLSFEGITELENQLIAYIPAIDYDSTELEKALNENGLASSVSIELQETIDEKNWNEEWEKNFEPVFIDSRCVIRAPFHETFDETEYVITIEPKMSFGTGHHATTSLIVSRMLEIDFSRKRVLDMGCGTGILGILACKRGAESVTGIDNDTWAYQNSLENASRNQVEMQFILGGDEVIPDQSFTIIIANINRNILLMQKQAYYNHLEPGGQLLLSGILIEDTVIIRDEFEKTGFTFTQARSKGNWQMMEFIKN